MQKYCFVIVGLFLVGLLSCSSDQDQKKKETLPPQTQKISEDAAKMLKTPLEQAKKAAEQENSHLQRVDEEVGKTTN